MIDVEKFKELRSRGLSLDLIFILENWEDCRKEESIKPLLLTLDRKGYTLGGLVTQSGKELLESLTSKKIKTKKFPKFEDEFDRWWKIYPGTTEFTYRGRTFTGSRALRVKKEECKTKFESILSKGTTGEEMLMALEKEIEQKKNESLKTGQNKLNFMQNTLTYLNQRTFEPYIELIKESSNNKPPGNTIDI